MKKRVLIYITDHGYGHASRIISLVKHWLSWDRRIKFFIRSQFTADFVKGSLAKYSDRVEVISDPNPNDIGLIPGSGLKVDKEKTKKAVENWILTIEKFIEKETHLWKDKKIDLLISDIVPQAFPIARVLGIPSAGISNFNWADTYEHLFGVCDFVDHIKKMHSNCDIFYELPFESINNSFEKKEKQGLTARKSNPEKVKKIKEHISDSGEKIIYFGLGKSISQDVVNKMSKSLLECKDNKFILTQGCDISLSNSFTIPGYDLEGQDYIAAADLVLIKPGYSTIAEAVIAKKPICSLDMDSFPEYITTNSKIKELGIGEVLSVDNILEGEWQTMLKTLDKYIQGYKNIDDRYRLSAENDLISKLNEL